MADSCASSNTRRRMAAYWIVGLGLLFGFAATRDSIWISGVQLHTAMEVVSTLLASIVGTVALVRFYAKKNNTYLLIGTGFLGAAFLDGYHAFVTAAFLKQFVPLELLAQIPWTGAASRQFLSVLMFLSILAWLRERRLGESSRIGEETAYVFATLLALASLLLFTFVPPPRAFDPEVIFHRPEALLPALFFAMALVGYLRKGAWQHDSFEHWLVLSLIVGLVGQAGFVSFSGLMHDMEFDTAHLLKIASYLCVLAGLLTSIFSIFRQAEDRYGTLAERENRRERAGAEAVRNEQNSSAILEAISDAIVTVDRKGIVDSFNSSAETLFGYSAADVIGRNIEMLILGEWAPDYDGGIADNRAVESSSIIVAKHDLLGLRKDGTTFNMELTFNEMQIDGQRRYAGILRDITEKMETQRDRDRLLLAVDKSGDGMILFDTDDRFIYANDKYKEIYPSEIPDLVQGKTFRDIVKRCAYDGIVESAIGREEEWIEERVARHQSLIHDGEHKTSSGRWVRINEFRTEDGCLFGVRRDITERKEHQQSLIEGRAELENAILELNDAHQKIRDEAGWQIELLEDLDRARGTAESAVAAKSEFLSTMSHEIRTPMNGVLGMLGLLLNTDLTEQQKKFATTALESGNSLLAIINDILDYSKLESGKLELDESDFDIAQVIDGVHSLLSYRAKPGVTLRTDIDPAFPQWLRADRGRLRQVLFNLAGNAIKFTDKGQVTISASHRVIVGDEVELRIEVSDTGIGLSDEARNKLFTRFAQADSSTSRKFGGTGLGLAICKQIVELMGGDIGVESEPDVGSTFWFTIRCRVGEEPVSCAPETPVSTGSWARPLRILIAEDIHINRMLVTALVDKAGHHYDVVGNGLEAVEAVRTAPYDLVLMDIQMPEMDGATATREIRQLPGAAADIPIIAVTAHAMAGHREEYLAAGMNDYVSKPIDPALLMEALARVCPPDVETAATAAPLAADPAKANTDGAGGAAPLFDEGRLGELRDTIGEDKLHGYLADLPGESNQLLRDIQDALAAGDLGEAQKAAHDLKGMAGNFCATRVAAIAKEIESRAPTVEAAKRESENLKLAIEQTQQWLNEAS